MDDDESILTQIRNVVTRVDLWQFVLLDPRSMGYPYTTTRTRGRIKLQSNGANVAEYLLEIREHDLDAFEGIIEALSFVLPYARDVQPLITREIERAAYIQMTEQDYKVPGWLLSTGTLRILALLALLRDPDPPPLIVIEELENGLDPRTIHLIIGEIKDAVARGDSQIIATTHSPYLLDFLPPESFVVVEKVKGATQVRQLKNRKEIQMKIHPLKSL